MHIYFVFKYSLRLVGGLFYVIPEFSHEPCESRQWAKKGKSVTQHKTKFDEPVLEVLPLSLS
jgi:hypothetical protein